MNKQEIQNQIQALEEELARLKVLAGKPDIPPEERFLQLVDINNISIKINKEIYPDSVFFFNGETFLAEYDKKFPKNIWINFDIWDVFENEYGMKYHEIQGFIRKQIRRYFNWEKNKPLACPVLRSLGIHGHFNFRD